MRIYFMMQSSELRPLGNIEITVIVVQARKFEIGQCILICTLLHWRRLASETLPFEPLDIIIFNCKVEIFLFNFYFFCHSFPFLSFPHSPIPCIQIHSAPITQMHHHRKNIMSHPFVTVSMLQATVVWLTKPPALGFVIPTSTHDT